MRGISRIVCGAVFTAVAFVFAAAATAFPSPVRYAMAMDSDDVPGAAHLARFDVPQFLKWLFVPFSAFPKSAAPSKVPTPRSTLSPDMPPIVSSPFPSVKPSHRIEPRITPRKSPAAAAVDKEVANAFLKAIEEARKSAGPVPAQAPGRTPTPEQMRQIIKLFEEAARKAEANRSVRTPASTSVMPVPISTIAPFLPVVTPAM